MSDKFRTPTSKRVFKAASASKAGSDCSKFSDTIHTFTHRQMSKPDLKGIEDEGLPSGFSLLGAVDDTTRIDDKNNGDLDDDDDAQSTDDMPGPSTVSDTHSSEEGNPSSMSIVAEFDELMLELWDIVDEDVGDEFLEFAINQESCRLEWLKAVEECRRLQAELDKANHDNGDFSNKLNHARKLLDQEKKHRRRAEEERDCLERQMVLARDLLFSDKCRNKLPDETREKLAFLNNTSLRSHRSLDNNGGIANSRLNTISEVNSQELNSTGSLLTDLSYSRSEDDLDSSAIHAGRKWMKHHPAPHVEEPTSKRRRSSTGKVVEINASDKIVATTTVSVSKDGPITATSVIESVPQEAVSPPASATTTQEAIERMWRAGQCGGDRAGIGRPGPRQHSFAPKTVIRPDTCGPCNKRIRFGKIVLRCKECRGVCHSECRDRLPLPCIPLVNTPTQKGGAIGTIADYAPSTAPMVPALIVHCVNEVELRGLDEIGIYRVPGAERDVKLLKERFLKGKGAPMLDGTDVHVLCGVIKDFLRSLQEPLVTQALWREFIGTAEVRDVMDVPPLLYQAVSRLPLPNRDTLAYVMLHLQRVAESKECKMPVGNLAKVFGPTIVGYSSHDPDPNAVLAETRQQAVVMEYLLRIPSDYWETFVNVPAPVQTPMAKTPSTDLPLRQNSNRGFFTPHSVRSVQSIRKQKKFFGTPPNN